MNIPWDKIIEVVLELIKECMAEGRSDEYVNGRLCCPTFADWLRLRHGLRTKHGIRGNELRDCMEAARNASANAGDEIKELRALLIEEAKST